MKTNTIAKFVTVAALTLSVAGVAGASDFESTPVERDGVVILERSGSVIIEGKRDGVVILERSGSVIIEGKRDGVVILERSGSVIIEGKRDGVVIIERQDSGDAVKQY